AFFDGLEVLFLRVFCDTACARNCHAPVRCFSRNPRERVKAADRFSSECAQYSTFSAKINDLAVFRPVFGRCPAIRVKRGAILCRQSPLPGLEEKSFSNLPSWPSKSFASDGESFFWVMFGHAFAYSAFTSSHFSSPGSVSGLIASAGHSGSHTPQ